MNSTSPFGPEFIKNTVDTIIKSMDEASLEIVRKLWSNLISFIIENWLIVISLLILILILAVIKYATTGRWRMLGVVLYNYLYFFIIFIIALMCGPDIFVSDWFSIMGALILNPICYLIVRKILNKTGIRSN